MDLAVERGTTDAMIRAALLTRLRLGGDPAALLLQEMQMEHFRAFVDVAAIGTLLHCFEIKSDVDSVSRLKAQAYWTNCVADLATVVVAPRHLAAAERIVPSWWGVITATSRNEVVMLTEVRVPQRNPERNAQHVLNLLRKEELMRVMRALAPRASSARTKPKVIEALLATLGAEGAMTIATGMLRYRKTWSARPLAVADEQHRLAHALSQPRTNGYILDELARQGRGAPTLDGLVF